MAALRIRKSDVDERPAARIAVASGSAAGAFSGRRKPQRHCS